MRIHRLSAAVQAFAAVLLVAFCAVMVQGRRHATTDASPPAPAATFAVPDEVVHPALANGRIYYVDGRTVLSVAVRGGPPRTEVRGANIITAFCVSDRIYWSELGVSVRSAGRVYWSGAGGHHTTGLACGGHRLAWSDCPAGNFDCTILVEDTEGRMGGFAVGAEPWDLRDNGDTVAYLTADGPHVGRPGPVPAHRDDPPASADPECRRRPCGQY